MGRMGSYGNGMGMGARTEKNKKHPCNATTKSNYLLDGISEKPIPFANDLDAASNSNFVSGSIFCAANAWLKNVVVLVCKT
jgi:hypothetical protein